MQDILLCKIILALLYTEKLLTDEEILIVHQKIEGRGVA